MWPRPRYLCLLLLFNASVVSAWGADRFAIKGKIVFEQSAAALLAQQSPGLRTIIIDVRHDSLIETPIQSQSANPDGTYRIVLDSNLRGRDIFLTAETPPGIITSRDYVVDVAMQNRILTDANSDWSINLDIRISTVPERFVREINRAEASVHAKDFDAFFATLDRVLTSEIALSGDLYYRSRQQFTEGLHNALSANHRASDVNLARIFDFEKELGFQSLSPEQRYNIYLQMARALSQSPFAPSALLVGRPQWQIIDHCFLGALEAGKEVKTADDFAKVQTERIHLLMKANAYAEAFAAVSEYFELIPTDRQPSQSQKDGAVPLLQVLADLIERKKKVLLFSLDENVEDTKTDPELLDLWISYERFATPWQARFPEGSKTEIGRRLRAIFNLAVQIVKRVQNTQ